MIDPGFRPRERIMRLLICTTGTSVATGVGPFHGDGDAEAFRERIRARVRSLDDPQRPDDLLRAVSAESNSLGCSSFMTVDDSAADHDFTRRRRGLGIGSGGAAPA